MKTSLKILYPTMDTDFYVSFMTENKKEMKSIGIERWVLQIYYDKKHKRTNEREYLNKDKYNNN